MILTGKELKKLENLFSWSQFYENSESLTVARYPRHYTWVNNKRTMNIPYTDKIRFDNVQKEIKKIMNN